MNSLTSCENGQIRPIVGEQRHCPGEGSDGAEPRQNRAWARILRAELDESRPRGDDTLGERQEGNPGALEEVRIDDGVKTALHVGCGPSPGWDIAARMGFGGRLFSAIVVLATFASRTSAAETPMTPAPELPKVPLHLQITEDGPDSQWEMKLENASSVPIEAASDARLLWFEVSRPGESKQKLCRLPDDLFPKNVPDSKTKELAPGDSLVQRFDPRFYCFSAGRQEILVPSAQIIPHYGFSPKTKAKWVHGRRVEETLPDAPPYIATPKDSDSMSPAKNVTGDMISLDDRYAAWAESAKKGAESKDDDEPTLDIVRGSDAETERNVMATVRIRNPSESRVALFVRRELITFEVMTPAGTTYCVAEPDARDPDRRAFTTLAPKSSMTIVSRLVELCPRGTFAKPGLYVVQARFDAQANGAEYGLDAFTGTIHTTRPVTVRVRRELHIVPNRRLVGSAGPAAPGAPPPPSVPGLIPPPPQENAPPPPPAEPIEAPEAPQAPPPVEAPPPPS